MGVISVRNKKSSTKPKKILHTKDQFAGLHGCHNNSFSQTQMKRNDSWGSDYCWEQDFAPSFCCKPGQLRVIVVIFIIKFPTLLIQGIALLVILDQFFFGILKKCFSFQRRQIPNLLIVIH